MNYKQYINADSLPRSSFFSKEYFLDWLLQSEQYVLSKYVRTLRKEEYYSFYKSNKVLKYYYKRKKNILSQKLGFFIHAGNFGAGLKIYHYGSIILHPMARIGKNCTIHGNCCIGSKGVFPDEAPVIGDNVDIGQGAQILGGITIADGVKIGAGAIVTKSILEPNVTVISVSTRIIS